MRRYTTRTQLRHSRYPFLQVVWVEERDAHGFWGQCRLYDGSSDGGTRCAGHTLHVRMCSPVGTIVVSLDARGDAYGCYRTMEFEGVDITVRDLQWAALWGAMAIEAKHADPRHLFHNCPGKDLDESGCRVDRSPAAEPTGDEPAGG